MHAFDNLVQWACAQECQRSGLASENFESVLAFVTLSETKVTLHYRGIVVNTGWDDEFLLVGDGLGPHPLRPGSTVIV